MSKIVPFILLILATPRLLFAAVGCDLNDPDKDVKKLFPGSTGYKTEYVSISQKGGDSLLARIEQRLGDRFQGLFETGDVPYTMYRVFRKKELAGYIHGVNQKGTYGGIQVFLALDTAGVIKTLYFQKLTSKAAAKLRHPSFGKQFAGLTLRDFYKYDVATGKENGSDKITAIKNPSEDAASDFRSALRAVKKNLILVDEFLMGNRYLPYYKPN
jgi:hypothetical protein